MGSPEPSWVKLLEDWPFYDNAIVRHGFTPYWRDYEIYVDAIAARPDGAGSFVTGRYRFRFTHCVKLVVGTHVSDMAWMKSWSDVYVDYAAWEKAGRPEGYVWGTNWMNAYPGAKYVRQSQLAGEWTSRLNQSMHEVRIEADAHSLQLIFHHLTIHKVAQGVPENETLMDIEPTEVRGAAEEGDEG